MKIALCTNFFYPSVGGSQHVSKKLADYLTDCQHNVAVFTRRLPARKSSNFKYNIIEYYPNDHKDFNKKLTGFNPDVVFIYSDVFDFFRQIITETPKFRIIVAPCGSNWVYSNRAHSNIVYRNSSNISDFICHSIYDRDYKFCSSGILKNKCHIIPNGVDVEEFDENKIDRASLLPNDYHKRWILNVSNFFPGKGQNHMIRILNSLPSHEPIVYIQISTDTEFRIAEQLETQWKKLVSSQLNKNISVVYKKNIKRSETVAFFKQSNAFVLSSEKEVAPLTILESMAASTPWVSSDVGNTRELKGGRYIAAVKDARYHSLFDDRVIKLFGQSLQEVLDTPLIGEDGRNQIDKGLTWEKILPRYLSIINK